MKSFLIFLLVLFAAAAGYFLAKPKSTPVPSLSSLSVVCENLNWQMILPQMENILKSELDPAINQFVAASIVEETDLTGDGCTEALVSTGTGGAYTTIHALFRAENATPVIVLKKESDGEVNEAIFEAGASVRNQIGFQTLSGQNGFYLFAKQYDSVDGQITLANCAVDGYVWNDTMKRFDYNQVLTQSSVIAVCAN